MINTMNPYTHNEYTGHLFNRKVLKERDYFYYKIVNLKTNHGTYYELLNAFRL